MKDSASDCYLSTVSDLIEIYQPHKEYVIQKCDWVCPKNEIYDLHKKLRDFDDYTEWIRDKNLTDKNEIIKTVALVFNSSSKNHEVFWWINLIMRETINVPEDATLSWHARFC